MQKKSVLFFVGVVTDFNQIFSGLAPPILHPKEIDSVWSFWGAIQLTFYENVIVSFNFTLFVDL